MPPRTGCALLIALVPALAGAGCLAQEQPAATPTPAAAPRPTGEFSTADDLLNALERADQNLVSLTAEVRYDRTFELQGDRQVRLGNLYFVNNRPAPPTAEAQPLAPDRKFAVSFKSLQVGEILREEPKVYIFDGQ